jgi:hypothetical protein
MMWRQQASRSMMLWVAKKFPDFCSAGGWLIDPRRTCVMPAIVEFPRVVQEVAERCADLFPNEPQRRHFAEYLTGLIVAQRKSVSGINAQFADTTDQSCLNRFLTAADWNVADLNAQRLAWLQEDEATQYHDRGVIAIDDVLIDHDGQLIQDVGWFWDHAEGRHKIAHDWLFASYVCPARLLKIMASCFGSWSTGSENVRSPEPSRLTAIFRAPRT